MTENDKTVQNNRVPIPETELSMQPRQAGDLRGDR